MIRSLSHSLKTISSLPIWPLVIVLAATPITHASEATHSTQTDLSALAMSRDYYLNDLIQPHRYTPGKNSFLFQTLHLGQRKTVLNLVGSGSVRHLWITWSIPGSDMVSPGRVLLRVFVDKQPNPSMGPLGPETSLPNAVSEQSYETTVVINKPTKLTERWQDVRIISGFLDLTYQFRHYALVESGSGFVAGPSRTKLTTYIYSSSLRTVEAILGHDDEVLVQLNGATLSNFSGRSGFGPSPLHIPLRMGWNTLDLVLSNEENDNWRWSGLSLALRRGQNQDQGLRFSSKPPSSSSALVNMNETLTKQRLCTNDHNIF